MTNSSRFCSNIVYNPQDEREGKMSTNISSFVYPDAGGALRELIQAWGYDPNNLNSKAITEIGEHLGKFLRGQAYSRVYVANILAGRPVGDAVRVGILNLLAVAVDGARIEQIKTHAVSVLTECNLHTGSLVLVDSRLCVCGLHFVPKSWNQKFHAKECRRLVK